MGTSVRQPILTSSANSFVQNGNLVIQTEYNGSQYTSTQLRTVNDWRFCRIDIRAKLPRGGGMWPAFWMMATNQSYGAWPLSGEIDIMENLGNNVNQMYTTLHFGAGNSMIQGTANAPANASLADSFHVYTMIWDSGSFNFYLDGNNYFNVTSWSPGNVAYPAPFDVPFYLMLNIAVGGWAGAIDNSVFPQQMLVDYVRVYKRQAASTEIARTTPKTVHNRASATKAIFMAAGNRVELSQNVPVGTKTVDICDIAGKVLDRATVGSDGSVNIDRSRVGQQIVVVKVR